MPYAQLTLRPPDGAWIKDVSSTYPGTEFRVLAAMPGDDKSTALVEVTGPDLPSVIGEMDGHDGITSFELLEMLDDDTVLIQVTTTCPMLFMSARGAKIPIIFPITIADGDMQLEVQASPDRISALGQVLEQHGIGYDVDAITQQMNPEQLLTACQRDIVTTAVELGYYDTPRECSLTDLADELDIAKSTASETLHTAEAKIVEQFLDHHLDEFGKPNVQ